MLETELIVMSKRTHRSTPVLWILSLFLLAMLALAACSTQPNTPPQGNQSSEQQPGDSTGNGPSNSEEQPEDAEDLPEMRHVEENEIDGSLRTFVEANLEYPGVHFLTMDEEVYVLVSWGEKSTGGYEVNIRDLKKGGPGDYTLTVELTQPAEGDMVTQAVTYPYDLVAIQARGSRFSIDYTGDVDPEQPISGEGIIGPNLIVETPQPGDTIGSTLNVSGTARVFEASFMAVLEDGHNELYKGVITADAGAPEWGRFNEEIAYTPTDQQHGLLILTVYSMRDGSVSEQVIIPVQFE